MIGLFIQPTPSRADLRAGWLAEYYANPTLDGQPSLITYDDAIDMNWSTAAPDVSLPSDYFSVRWSSQVAFEGGIYRFRVGADDGIRLSINGQRLIDTFEVGEFRSLTQDVYLATDEYRIEVEYYEATGSAGVLVDWVAIAHSDEAINLATLSPQLAQEAVSPLPQASVASAQTMLYRTPSRTSPHLLQLNFAQTYAIVALSDDGQWVQLQLADGRQGWAWRTALYLHPAPE
jgi:hypothetical protein